MQTENFEEVMYNLQDMTRGELFFYNWNRIAYLQERGDLSELDKIEITMRIGFQNTQDYERIRKTMTSKVIESVNRFMKRI